MYYLTQTKFLIHRNECLSLINSVQYSAGLPLSPPAVVFLFTIQKISCCLPFENVLIMMSVSDHWVCSISATAGDFVSSSFFTGCELRVFFLRCLRASLSVTRSLLASVFETYVVFVLIDDMSLRWLRVMVTLKVCVCCSSILSSSDTLMKGHQAKA